MKDVKPEKRDTHLDQVLQDWPADLRLERLLWESELLPEPIGQAGQPWGVQPGETRWHKRFLLFLSLGSTRTLQNTYALYRRAQGKTSPGAYRVPLSWRRAAERFDWDARAQAWDTHLDDFIRQRFNLTTDILRLAAPEAALTMVMVMREGTPPQRRQAADSILDRVGIKGEPSPEDEEPRQIHIFEVIAQAE